MWHAGRRDLPESAIPTPLLEPSRFRHGDRPALGCEGFDAPRQESNLQRSRQN
jgi:hypothetical protein